MSECHLEADYMTLGEANWILWGLTLQVGLCPTCRVPLTMVHTAIKNVVMFEWCHRCNREWYLDYKTGLCAGWWARGVGVVQQPERSAR